MRSTFVTAGLVPAIQREDCVVLDHRDEPGDDDWEGKAFEGGD